MKKKIHIFSLFFFLMIGLFSACHFEPTILRKEDKLFAEKMQSVSHTKIVDYQQFRNEIQNGAEGIYLSFSVENPTKWAVPTGFDSYEISVYLQQNNQRLKLYRPFKDLSDKRTPECVMTSIWAQTKSDTNVFVVFVPYSDLHFLKMGEHSLAWEIEGNFVKSPPANDSTQGFRRQTDIKALLRFHTPIPEIYYSEIAMDILQMDTTKFKPDEMDFHLFGPGYPDIFWEIKKGDEIIFKSDSCRNEITYCRKDKVKSLYFTQKETIYVSVYDFDSFLNNDDEMGNIKLTPTALAKKDSQNLAFGFVKKMNIYMKTPPTQANK